MYRLTFTSILAHKRRLFTTALAVMLGVAFLAGTLILTDTIGRTFDNLMSDVYKGTDAVVRAPSAFNGVNNSGAQRPRVAASLVDTVARINGVAQAEGQIFGYARIIAKDGTPLGNPANGAPTLGGNWSDFKQLNAFKLASGRAPQRAGEVVIDRKSSRDGNLAVGDTTTVLVQGGPQRVKIVGVAKFGSADSPGGASFVLFTLPEAQRLIAEPGKYDSISLVAASGVSQTELVRRVSSALPAGIEVVTGKQVTKESQDDIKKALSFFNTFMLVFALIAVLVGAFMIFNTFSITVAQRTRENALLRALGASRRQVLASVMIEAVVIGLVASVMGLAVGALVARSLQSLLRSLGFDIPTTGMVFASRTVVISLVVGVAVTAFSSLSPARKAAKAPPIAAMQQVATGSTGYGSKQRIIVGTTVLGSGIAVLFYGLFGHTSRTVQLVGLGMVLAFFGVSALGRTVSLPLSQVLGWPLPRMRGAPGDLARENAMRNPKRTASSASALMIGVGVVAFITILATSTKVSMNAIIDRAFTGDVVVDSGGGQMGGVDPSLAQRVAALPEVSAASAIRVGMASVDDKVVPIAAGDPLTAFQTVDVKPQQGSTAALSAVDAVGVYKDVAKSKHLTVGSTLPMLFKDSGLKQMRVALIYGENRPAGDYLLGMPAYEANFANRLDQTVFIKKSSGTSAGAVLSAVREIARDYPGAKVLDQAGLKQEQAKPVNQLLALIYALLTLAIIIALMGIGNTLALSIFERTHELGLLRAVGMTRSQLRTAVRWESVIIALQGTVLGLVIGVFFGWALVLALKKQHIDQFSVPFMQLAIVVILAAIAGIVAAILPARRAARLNVLDAITHE